ncbi:hypothetical protein SDC9_128229 [bioreactor metagenome]|uniref:Uncharacterized protein n=1 Tax=bioreactor metagenome TaxID=1076179 RepID=A0A645CW88_9ZZZZ
MVFPFGKFRGVYQYKGTVRYRKLPTHRALFPLRNGNKTVRVNPHPRYAYDQTFFFYQFLRRYRVLLVHDDNAVGNPSEQPFRHIVNDFSQKAAAIPEQISMHGIDNSNRLFARKQHGNTADQRGKRRMRKNQIKAIFPDHSA